VRLALSVSLARVSRDSIYRYGILSLRIRLTHSTLIRITLVVTRTNYEYDSFMVRSCTVYIVPYLL
jgi:hypothetical protein